MKMTINTNFVVPGLLSGALGIAAALLASSASANPRPLPFTYPYATLPEGASELELYTDVNPLRVNADATDPSKGRLWEPQYRLQTEFEYGLTDRWELGFYQVFSSNPGDGGGNAMSFDGLKWRVRTRLAEAGDWPVDVGLYFEIEALHDELALEEKVNLERRFGDLALMANLWIEEELFRPFDSSSVFNGAGRALFVVNPTLGATYQVTPTFHPGLELWARGLLSPDAAPASERNGAAVRTFLGPTMHFDFGRLWWSAGLYFNMSDAGAPQPGDAYGRVWLRTVLGLELGS